MANLRKALQPLTRKLAVRLARKRRRGRRGPLDFRSTVRHSLSYGISGQFSKVRSFVFIDGVDEVTRFFEGVEDINEAVHRVNTEADVVWVDGHSDYGHAFEVFLERWGQEITPRTTILLLGDARNNYHASNAWVVKEMRHKARHVYWLNPEPRSYWDTGDSIIGDYATHCDGVYECRNLRQLERFVEVLA